MLDVKELLKEYSAVEKEFFEIDEEKGIAHVKLHFESASDLFEENCLSKTPRFNADSDDWFQRIFALIPPKYRISLEIMPDDMQGCTPEELHDIFVKNILLTAGTITRNIDDRIRRAAGLILAGLITFAAMILAGRLWAEETLMHDVFFYALDIITTVLFWEAAGILFVENTGHFRSAKAYLKHFEKISFMQTDRDTSD